MPNSVTSETKESISSYYDSNVIGKLNGFVSGNPRVEFAWKLIESFAIPNPGRILEIGCGIGDVSWRMSTQWTEANVLGIDISPASIAIAERLFGSDRLRFLLGPLEMGMLSPSFDLIVLVDVYEHIRPADRGELNRVLNNLLTENSRIILTFPTPGHQKWLRSNAPDLIQPIDEDIRFEDIAQLAHETGTRIIFYREISVWHEGDYAHAVLERCSEWAHRPIQAPPPALWNRLLHKFFPSGKSALHTPQARQRLVNERLGERREYGIPSNASSRNNSDAPR